MARFGAGAFVSSANRFAPPAAGAAGLFRGLRRGGGVSPDAPIAPAIAKTVARAPPPRASGGGGAGWDDD